MTVVSLNKVDAEFCGVWIKWGFRELSKVVMRREETPCLWVAITEDKIRETRIRSNYQTNQPILIHEPGSAVWRYNRLVVNVALDHLRTHMLVMRSQLQTPYIPKATNQLFICNNLSIRKVAFGLWHAAASIHAGWHVDPSLLTVQFHSYGMFRYMQIEHRSCSQDIGFEKST
jgi:hypothetical protein